MKLSIKTFKGNTVISGDTFAIKEQIKALPATRWNKTLKGFVMPATVGAMRNIRDLIKSTGAAYEADAATDLMRDLLKRQDAAQAVKQHTCTKNCPAWHHQGEALKFAQHQPAVIFNMPTGTGKTKLNIDLAVMRGHQFILVITKKKAVSVWKKDVAKFLGADAINVVQLDTGSVAKNVKLAEAAVAATDGKPVMLVTNYQSVWRDAFKKFILKQPIDLLILDESHMIKSAGSKASRFLATLRKRVASVAALSATFFGDKPIDIYAQMRTIDPCVYGTSKQKFQDKYCFMGGQTGREILGYKNQDEMMERLTPYIYQVDKEVLNLMPVRSKTYYCQLSASAQKIYNRFDADAFTATEDGKVISADNILVKLLRCQQMASGFMQVDDSDELVRIDTAKFDTLAEILEGLPDNENVPQHVPVVVYAKFTPELAGIKEVADQLGYTYGEISGRIDQQEDFKTGKVNLLGCQIDAGGTGVDGLQDVAHIAIYFSTGVALIPYTQSLGRLDRGGQAESVLNIYIVCEKTRDEDVVQSLQNKEDVIESFNRKLRKLAEEPASLSK